jgi:superfamily II DNA/RNA helicase
VLEKYLGHDLIISSTGGSGKSMAAAIPILASIDAARPHPQAIVLAPSRELALNVYQFNV